MMWESLWCTIDTSVRLRTGRGDRRCMTIEIHQRPCSTRSASLILILHLASLQQFHVYKLQKVSSSPCSYNAATTLTYFTRSFAFTAAPTLAQYQNYYHSFHLVLGLQHSPNLRRQHQRAPIIPPIEIRHYHRCLLGLVFVNEVAGGGEHLELIFP